MMPIAWIKTTPGAGQDRSRLHPRPWGLQISSKRGASRLSGQRLLLGAGGMDGTRSRPSPRWFVWRSVGDTIPAFPLHRFTKGVKGDPCSSNQKTIVDNDNRSVLPRPKNRSINQRPELAKPTAFLFCRSACVLIGGMAGRAGRPSAQKSVTSTVTILATATSAVSDSPRLSKTASPTTSSPPPRAEINKGP